LVEKGGHLYAMKQMNKRKYNGILNFVVTEKEVQKKINHRFIVKLRYAFQTFDKFYLVTDYCPGGDMRGLIIKNKKTGLPEDVVRVYMAELILAVEEIHQNGIIHRDIKPDNVLFDAEGHAMLCDFGLSKEGMFQKKLTRTVLGGGYSYQIPEVLNERPYDKSVDVYLLGLVAYEMLCGKSAFPSNEMPIEMLNKRIKESQFNLPQSLSSEAKDMLCKLIVADPQNRLGITRLKKHPFFSKIDWKAASEGKLSPPKPELRPVSQSYMAVEDWDSMDGSDKEGAFDERKNEEGGEGIEYVYDHDLQQWVQKEVKKGEVGSRVEVDDDPFENGFGKVPGYTFIGNQGT